MKVVESFRGGTLLEEVTLGTDLETTWPDLTSCSCFAS